MHFSKGEQFYPCDLFFAGDDITKNWFRYTRMKQQPPLTYYYNVRHYDDGSKIIQYWFYFAYNIYPFAAGPGKIAVDKLIGSDEKETRANLVNRAKNPNEVNRLIRQTDEVAEIPIRDIFLNLKRLLAVMDNHDHDFEKILVFLSPDEEPTDVLLNHHLERFHYGAKEIREIGYPFWVYVERNSHGFCHTHCPPFIWCGDGLRTYGRDYHPVAMEDLKAKVEEVENRGIPVLDTMDNALMCHDKTSLKIVVPWAREEFVDPKRDLEYVAVVDILERLGLDYDNPFVSLFNRAFIGLASQIMPLCDDVPGFVSFFSRLLNKFTNTILFWRK